MKALIGPRYGADHVGSHQRRATHFLEGYVAGETVKINAEGQHRGPGACAELRREAGEHARQDIPCSGRAHARIARGVDVDMAIWGGDHGVMPLEDEGRV